MFFVARKHQVAGSSPRLRGTLSRTERRSCSRRFIPAFAGNATREIDAERELPVHPRVCGERTLPLHHWLTVAGSSPRLRGTQSMTVTLGGITRFIPAFAGNAASSRPASTPRPVHPRVCGERAPVAACSSRMSGSSPRLRGTPEEHLGHVAHGPVHPRVCGERTLVHTPPICTIGSSPRLRGTHKAGVVRGKLLRFIPAFAGNAWPPVPGMPAGSVHPRVCGERISLSDGAVKRGGSSPRLRGTQQRAHCALLVC